MIWRVFIKTTAILPGVWFCYIRGQFGFIIDLWRQYWVRVCTYHTRGVKFSPGVISSFMEGFVCCSTSHWGVKFFPVVIRSGMEGVFFSRMSLWSRQLYCAHHTPWCVKVHRCGHRRLEDYPVCIALYFQGVTILTGVSTTGFVASSESKDFLIGWMIQCVGFKNFEDVWLVIALVMYSLVAFCLFLSLTIWLFCGFICWTSWVHSAKLVILLYLFWSCYFGHSLFSKT